MLPSQAELDRMSLRKMEDLLRGCHPGTAMKDTVQPAYEIRLRRANVRRAWIFFTTSTLIALAAFWLHR